MPEIKLLKKETPDPTKELVECYLSKWGKSKKYLLEEAYLFLLFNKIYPYNKTIKDVFLKACAVNTIDNTRIDDVCAITDRIVSLDIDEKLKSEDLKLNLQLVKDIAVDPTGNRKKCYPFASKYCARHKPNIYPMYDSHVCSMLWHFQKKYRCIGFKRKDLEDYVHFETILRKFINCYKLNDFSLREIDIYLWLSFKEYKKE